MGNNVSDNFSDFDEFDFSDGESRLIRDVTSSSLELDEEEFLDQNGATIYMYIMGEAQSSFYRVGHTLCPQLQHAKIQAGNPRKLIFKCIMKLRLIKNKRGAFFKLKDLAECIEANVMKDLSEYHCKGDEVTNWFEFTQATKPILYDVFEKIVCNTVKVNKDWVKVESVPKKR